jgi:hypothetical protein
MVEDAICHDLRLAHKSPDGFDRYQHQPFSERRKAEAAALIAADGWLVDCRGNDAANSGDFGSGKASSRSIRLHGGAHPLALPPGIDGKPANQREWHFAGGIGL